MQIDSNVYTITILGACGVGKSSILTRYIYDKFSQEYSPTIWDSYRIVKTFDSQQTQLEVIDTGGLEGSNSPVTKISCEKAKQPNRCGFILVYDICNIDSYKVSIEMLQQIKSDVRKSKITCILIGNRTDNQAGRQVNQLDAQKQAQKLQTKLVECSAKQNQNIETIFLTLVEGIELALMKKQRISTKLPKEMANDIKNTVNCRII